jgi:hypothetical protein
MRKLLSLVACTSFEQCNTCIHFIKSGKCKMFPLITNLNDDIVYGYDYVSCTTARSFSFMCENGKLYEKIELFKTKENAGKNESKLSTLLGVRGCS